MMKKSVLRTALLYIGLPLGFLLLDYALDRQADNIVGLQPVHLVITSLLLLSVFFVLNRANEAQQRSSDYLRQARDELETRVQERTQELERSNAQLRIEIAQRQKAEADRSRSEQALRESEEQYRDMFDRFPEPVTVWDQSGVLLLENLISARNLGGSREEFIGRNISEIFGPAGNIYLERILRVAESGITETQDDMVELGIGRRYFWTSMLPVAGPGGQRAVQVISYDITERKNMEQALRVSEEKFATVFHSSPDAIAVIRLADSVLLDVNQAFSTLFGYDSKDVIGKSWVDLELALPKEVQNQVNETLRQQGRFVGYESEFQTRQGASITTITSLTMIKINGEDCILAVIHDITERKNSEKKLNEAQLELSRGIEERTALQERQRLARDLHDSVS